MESGDEQPLRTSRKEHLVSNQASRHCTDLTSAEVCRASVYQFLGACRWRLCCFTSVISARPAAPVEVKTTIASDQNGARCPLMAQSRHANMSALCPLSGVKRTCLDCCFLVATRLPAYIF